METAVPLHRLRQGQACTLLISRPCTLWRFAGGLLVSGGGISVRGGQTINERLQRSSSLPRTADDIQANRLLTQGFKKTASTSSRIADSEFACTLLESEGVLECQAVSAYERAAASFRSNNHSQVHCALEILLAVLVKIWHRTGPVIALA